MHIHLKQCIIITNMCVCVCLVTQSCPTLATPQTVACWAPLSMGLTVIIIIIKLLRTVSS